MLQFASKKLQIVLHSIFWLMATTIFIIIAGSLYDWNTAFYRTIINVLSLAFLFYGNALFLVNRYLERKLYVQYCLYTFLFFITLYLLRVQFNLFFPNNFYDPFINPEWQAYLFTLVTSTGVFLFSLVYQLLINRAIADRKNLEIVNHYNEAQIQFLKAQINPHFLFNTLNNIYALAITKSDDTPEMILKLSDLLRYVIYKGEEELVSLENEVLHIYKFIELFQMRSEEDLNIKLLIEGELKGILIEPMILIPLVENCFKHCDFDSNPHAFVEINLTIEQGEITFKTNNSKNDQNQQKDKTGGVGLINIQKRLDLKYPQKHQLQLTNKTTEFEVVLQLKL